MYNCHQRLCISEHIHLFVRHIHQYLKVQVNLFLSEDIIDNSLYIVYVSCNRQATVTQYRVNSVIMHVAK